MFTGNSKALSKCITYMFVSVFFFFCICRVALTPAVTTTLVKKGFTVNIEEGAGFQAKFRDADYANAGANIVNSPTALASDIVLKVRQPHDSDIPLFRDHSTLISFLYPSRNKPLIDKLSTKKMNAFGMYDNQ